MVAILTEQQPSETPFPVVERALAGNILAHLDDPRPGVGLREDGLPAIVWCDVPAGSFLMGSTKKDKDALSREQPQHDVTLSVYHISRYPVTNAQYQVFVDDGGYTEQWQACWTSEGWMWMEKKNITGPATYGGVYDLPNHPVVGVSWYEAAAFCQWLTIRLQGCGKLAADEVIKLPTEAQWEKAARSDDGRIYPWGNEITPELANYGDTGLGVTSTVGCFPRGISPYECEEMAGNVWEWCLDWFDENYYSESPKENPPGPVSGSFRVFRGGYWGYDARICRSAYRIFGRPGDRGNNIGFRLLRTP
ncbi:MAG: formylglycine-generating enzyme family protein [Gammaproteobacteria bacterium]|nr:formylglycine-generating enzyme family protein [Gammaproteobacteria bacterium]